MYTMSSSYKSRLHLKQSSGLVLIIDQIEASHRGVREPERQPSLQLESCPFEFIYCEKRRPAGNFKVLRDRIRAWR